MPLSFTERQGNAVVTAITILAAAIILLTIGFTLWLIVGFLRIFSGVFLPLAVGAVVALVFRPYYLWLNERVQLPAPIALAVVSLSILLPFGSFLWFFGSLAVTQFTDLVARVPDWWNDLIAITRERVPQLVDFLQTNPIGQRIREALVSQQESLFEGIQTVGTSALSVGAVLVRGIGTILSWAVLPVYFAFFLTRKPEKILLPAGATVRTISSKPLGFSTCVQGVRCKAPSVDSPATTMKS